jgi:hypothetical protein
MSLTLDPEIAAALAPMAESGFAPPAVDPGAPHEFDSIAFDSDVARRAIADRVRVLKSI